MNIKPIKTKKDYELAMTRLETLFDAKKGTSKGDELEVLSLLIDKYENDNFPIELPDPIDAINFMRHLIIIILLLSVFACKKTDAEFDGINCIGNCYFLTGKIVDTPANNQLKGVELNFYYKPASLMFDNTQYLGKTMTDEKGAYKFQFDGSNYKLNRGYFYIKGTKQDYFCNVHQNDILGYFNLDSTQINDSTKQNFSMFKVSKLKVHYSIQNNTNFQFLTFSYGIGQSTQGWIFGGGKYDTTIEYITAKDIRTFVNWNAVGNNVSIQKYDTLTATGTTLYYDVKL